LHIAACGHIPAREWRLPLQTPKQSAGLARKLREADKHAAPVFKAFREPEVDARGFKCLSD